MVARLLRAAGAEDQTQDQIDNGNQKAQVYPKTEKLPQLGFLFHLLDTSITQYSRFPQFSTHFSEIF